MTVTVRFAPSPTGLLHVGNARAALINWLFARHHGGVFLLRFDDTDRERSKPEFAQAIERDLRWLGLEWTRLVRQSDRLDRYQAVFESLRAAGRLYPCFETPDELEYKRKRQLARGEPPIYDRAALRLSEAEKGALRAEGRAPHWRFRLEPGEVAWNDLVRGRVSFDAVHLSDPVVMRGDGSFLYLLTSMIDDVDFAITHVIRGEDHVPNTALQIQVAIALGAPPPTFAHLPLMTDISGQGLSKRLGSLTLAQLREDGIEPMALNVLLARLGTAEPPVPCPGLDDLARDFDLADYGRATAKFDVEQLRHLNQRVLHETSFAAVAERLTPLGLAQADEAFWLAVRGNLDSVGEARLWHEVCFGRPTPVIEEPEFIEQALRLLPPPPWGQGTWAEWTGALKRATDRKGRALFQPLRLALTGLEHGPELKHLLPLIGHDRARQRLSVSFDQAPPMEVQH